MSVVNNQFMLSALEQAKKAALSDEVPVGAVLVLDGKIIAAGHNLTIFNNDPTAHAEVVAIREACRIIGNYRLTQCELYVTLEPCCMYAGAVVTANPFATKVGMDILRKGGNVVDAGVGVQYVLGLVEPQSSGLGGGSFTIFYHKKFNEIYAIDGREKAPKRIPLNFFEQYQGSRQGFFKLVTNPASVGVPGTPLLLEEMHARFGKLDWSELHDAAISLATKGFPISPRLHILVSRDRFLWKNRAAKDYFFSTLNEILIPKNVGVILKNPSYSNVLTQFRDQGISTTFYKGKIMSNILSDLKKQLGVTSYILMILKTIQ